MITYHKDTSIASKLIHLKDSCNPNRLLCFPSLENRMLCTVAHLLYMCPSHTETPSLRNSPKSLLLAFSIIFHHGDNESMEKPGSLMLHCSLSHHTDHRGHLCVEWMWWGLAYMGQSAGGYHCSLMTGAPFSLLRMSLKVENTFLKKGQIISLICWNSWHWNSSVKVFGFLPYAVKDF